MSRRFVFPIIALGVALWLYLSNERGRGVSPAISPPPPARTERIAPRGPREASLSAAFSPADYPLAAQLNTADSNVQRDLRTVSEIFDAWRTHFPQEGNPVGENREITAALTGDNRRQLALLPKNHPAINGAGELCDRWGTPFRFHQLSGQKMEIRSAGPDRKFGTADDAVWSPE